jgi:serine phosphatase RsbU (regulator of sigma subunit)
MGLGAKVGLLAGLVTLVVIAATLFLSGPGGTATQGDPDAEWNQFGQAAVSQIVTWQLEERRGGDEGGNRYETARIVMSKVWKERFDEWFQESNKYINTKLENTFQEQARKDLLDHVDKALAKYERGGQDTGTGVVRTKLSNVLARLHAPNGRYEARASWLRKGAAAGAEGEWIAGTISPQGVEALDMKSHHDLGNGLGYVDGALLDGGARVPVRVFTGAIHPPGTPAEEGVRAYVAVRNLGRSASPVSANPLGMLMLLLGPLAVGLVGASIAGAHTKNVRSLARDIDRLGSSGDPNRTLRAQGSEASALARAVERMVSNLEFRSRHQGKDLEEIVSREQAIAQEIHGALISRNPPRLSNYEVETLFKPGFEIGGDHFEYFQIDAENLGIILLDTNVRGVQAALVMATAKAYVRASAPGQLSPATVLKAVNERLVGELPSGRHVTALYAVLNQREGKATVASAGHLPLLVYRHSAGRLAKVNPRGIALGLESGALFERELEEGDVPIGVGDRIVMYTDGVLRIQNREGEEFGEQRFHQTVAAEAPKNSQAFVNFVGGAIDRFHLDAAQNDDITISTVKRLR